MLGFIKFTNTYKELIITYIFELLSVFETSLLHFFQIVYNVAFSIRNKSFDFSPFVWGIDFLVILDVYLISENLSWRFGRRIFRCPFKVISDELIVSCLLGGRWIFASSMMSLKTRIWISLLILILEGW